MGRHNRRPTRFVRVCMPSLSLAGAIRSGKPASGEVEIQGGRRDVKAHARSGRVSVQGGKKPGPPDAYWENLETEIFRHSTTHRSRLLRISIFRRSKPRDEIRNEHLPDRRSRSRQSIPCPRPYGPMAPGARVDVQYLCQGNRGKFILSGREVASCHCISPLSKKSLKEIATKFPGYR